MTSVRKQKKAERRRLAVLFSEIVHCRGYVRDVSPVSRESHRGRRKRVALAKSRGVPWWSLPPYRDRGLCLCYEPVWRVSFSGERTTSRRRECWTASITRRTCQSASEAVLAHTTEVAGVVAMMRDVRSRVASIKGVVVAIRDRVASDAPTP